MIIIKAVIAVIVCYLIGSFSFAQFFAKRYRKVNIYRSGDHTADASNVYRNISKPVGVLVWILDFLRVYVILWVGGKIFFPSNPLILLLIGMAIIVGHYLPIHNKFIGGHEIITYVGLLLYFAPFPTIIVIVLALLLILFFNQARFATYLIVIFTPILCYIFQYFKILDSIRIDAKYLIITSILMGLINFFVTKRKGEI